MTLPEGVIRANLNRLTEMLLTEHDNPTVLIVGGGSVGIGLETMYQHPDIRLLAFDIYGDDNVQFVADAHDIPLHDGSVDCVVVQAVLEHVLDPWKVVDEIHRVLKPDGLVYAETPFLQHVHEGPYDFTRFTESGHRWLFRRFSRVGSGVVTGPGVQLIWTIEGVVEGVFRSRRMATIVSVAIFWLRYLDRVIPEHYQIDGACCVYFLGRRTENPIAARDMPGHYRGAQHRKASGSRKAAQ
ncbi:MAG: class I SAM-dependent methyltransferase [Pseudonocardia sp.]|nr:class I SAM-dependent methyltransferase [Pseudonocardia sp.]